MDSKFLDQLSSYQENKSIGNFSAGKIAEKLESQQLVALAAEVARRRYEQTQNPNLVIRNSENFAFALMDQVFQKNEYPMSNETKKEFFDLVKKAAAKDANALDELKNKVNNPPPEVIQALLPFYHEYIKDKTGDELKKAQTNFLGQVSFPMIENKSNDLRLEDGYNSIEKAKIGAEFRKMRNNGIMDGIIAELEKANKNYHSIAINDKTISTAQTEFNNKEKNYKSVQANDAIILTPLAEIKTKIDENIDKCAKSSPSRKKLLELSTEVEQKLSEFNNTFIFRGRGIPQSETPKLIQFTKGLDEKINRIMLTSQNDVMNQDKMKPLVIISALINDLQLKERTNNSQDTPTYKSLEKLETEINSFINKLTEEHISKGQVIPENETQMIKIPLEKIQAKLNDLKRSIDEKPEPSDEKPEPSQGFPLLRKAAHQKAPKFVLGSNRTPSSPPNTQSAPSSPQSSPPSSPRWERTTQSAPNSPRSESPTRFMTDRSRSNSSEGAPKEQPPSITPTLETQKRRRPAPQRRMQDETKSKADPVTPPPPRQKGPK